MNDNNNTTTTTMSTIVQTTFSDSWEEHFELKQRIDFDELLESNLLAKTRHSTKICSILYSISGSISIVASTLLIIHILRSHDRLTTTYHRLIFGLSIADLFSSFAMTMGSVMIPKEMNYVIPNAMGSMMTCNLQGALVDIGMGAAAMYNCCICLYFYAIIKRNKKDKYIRDKMEKWFHGISILHPVIFAIIAYFQKLYFFNSYDGGYCFSGGFSARSPPHCIGYEAGEIPDEGGGDFSIPCKDPDSDFTTLNIFSKVATSIWSLTLLVIPPSICITTMVIMYRSVSKIEQRMQNYGVNSLQVSHDNNIERRDNENNDLSTNNSKYYAFINWIKTRFLNIVSYCRCCCCCFFCSHNYQYRSSVGQLSNNRLKSSKREILYRGTGFVLAWALVFIPMCIGIAFDAMSSPQETLYSIGHMLVAVTTPLQGLYNFLAFMVPKVRATIQTRTRRNENSSSNNWFEAFYTTYTSRGDNDRIKKSTNAVMNSSNNNNNKVRSGGIYSTAMRNNSSINKKPPIDSNDSIDSIYNAGIISEINQSKIDDDNNNKHQDGTNSEQQQQQQQRADHSQNNQEENIITITNAIDTAEESLSSSDSSPAVGIDSVI